MNENVKKEYFIPDGKYKDINYDAIVYDLNRLYLLDDTINELIDCRNKLDDKAKKDHVTLNFEIIRLANKKTFSTDEDLQKQTKELQEKLEIKKELFEKRNQILKNQILEFRKNYYKLFNKKIDINCGCLIYEMEKNHGKKLYYSLYLDEAYPSHLNLNRIIKKLKNKPVSINLTISDKKRPEYIKEKNEVIYSKSFPIDLNELEKQGIDLNLYIVPEYRIGEDGKKYTYLKITDIYNTNIDFKLGDLIKEKEDWKPINLMKESVLSYKKDQSKYIKNKTKIKKI